MTDEPPSVTASRQLAEESHADRRDGGTAAERRTGEGRPRQALPGRVGRAAIRPLGRPLPDHPAVPSAAGVPAVAPWRLGLTRLTAAAPDGPPGAAPDERT